MRPSWAKFGPSSAQDGAKLGLSWHLEAILVPRWPKMAKMTFRMRLQIAKMRFWRHLGGLWGSPGAVLGEKDCHPNGSIPFTIDPYPYRPLSL